LTESDVKNFGYILSKKIKLTN